MSRRVATLGSAGFAALLLVALTALLPVPYVLLSPGPTANTIGTTAEGQPLIRVEGRETFPTEGHLDLTTVAVTGEPGKDIDLLRAVAGWVDGESAVVPREQVYPPQESAQEARQRNAADMQNSQQDATIAAMRALGVPVSAVDVRAVLEDAPARGKLEAGDVILRVDDRPVREAKDVRQAVAAHRPGEELVVRVQRDGRELDARVVTREVDDAGGRRAVIGIVPGERYPFTVDISLEDIGGPSAGLMFALGIVDKLTPGALNAGQHVAGTGSIDPDGNVGPIGGIRQKLAGARGDGATVFLTPARNCAEARLDVPDGLRLVRVGSLAEALSALEVLRGGPGQLPSC